MNMHIDLSAIFVERFLYLHPLRQEVVEVVPPSPLTIGYVNNHSHLTEVFHSVQTFQKQTRCVDSRLDLYKLFRSVIGPNFEIQVITELFENETVCRLVPSLVFL